MLLVLILGLRIDQYIINENDHQPIQHRSTHHIHEIHERLWGIGEPEWHHHKIIVLVPSVESGLRYILI